jgi:hypothetical protein
MLVSLAVPATHDRGPLHMEQVLRTLHPIQPARSWLRLSFGLRDGQSTLFAGADNSLGNTLRDQLTAHYPECHLERHERTDSRPRAGCGSWTATLMPLVPPLPIRTYHAFHDPLDHHLADPLTTFLGVIAQEREPLVQARIELLARPATRRERARVRAVAQRIAHRRLQRHARLRSLYARNACAASIGRRLFARMFFAVISLGTRPSHGNANGHRSKTGHDKSGESLFAVQIHLAASAPLLAKSRALHKLTELAGAFAQFAVDDDSTFRLGRIRTFRSRHRKNTSVAFLSAEELATLWHPPTAEVHTSRRDRVESRELEPPARLASSGPDRSLAVLGRLKFRSRNDIVGLSATDRLRHLYIVGKTGLGKSTLLLNLLAADMHAGHGVGLIDVHGDLADAALTVVPRRRSNDVVFIDAGDQEHPVAFNVLESRSEAERPLVASGVVAAFQKLWGDSWGPRLEYVLRNSVLTLLETPGTSLVSLSRLLTDTAYRNQLTGRLHDPLVRSFWHDDFAHWRPQLKAEAVSPVLNKVGAFLSSPILRAIVGQPHGTLNLRQILDERKILIVNLSKGRMGEDASSLLGSLLVTGLQLAAMSRADRPEAQRGSPFFLVVDEFQNLASSAFATILSEARKYRLGLTLSHQFLEQVDEPTLAAIFGNVGSLCAFGVGARDAEVLARQFGGELLPQDLIALPKYRAYLQLLIDGTPSPPFSIATLPPPLAEDARRPDVLRRLSRQRYSRPLSTVRRTVEAALAAA